MLPFMNDGENRNPQPAGGDSTEQPNTGDISTDQGYLMPASHGRNLRHSTMTLFALFAIGAVCLYFMIKKTSPSMVQASVGTDEAQIEQAIAQLTGIKSEINSRMDDIIGRFYKFSDVDQIGVDELRKNPFRHDLFAGNPDTRPDQQEDLTRKMILQEETRKKAQQMQLLSIMESPQGTCCMINDKILYQNDTIDGLTVSKIRGDGVELTAEGITVKLKMTE